MKDEDRELTKDDFVNILLPAEKVLHDETKSYLDRLITFRNALIQCEQHQFVAVFDKQFASIMLSFPPGGRTYDYERNLKSVYNRIKPLSYLICHSDTANGIMNGIWNEY